MVSLLPVIAEGLDHSQAAAFASRLRDRTRQSIVMSPDGMEVPATIHTIDHNAIFRVLERITRGLFPPHGRATAAGL